MCNVEVIMHIAIVQRAPVSILLCCVFGEFLSVNYVADVAARNKMKNDKHG